MLTDYPLVAEQQTQAQPLCKNCDTPLTGHYCYRCGQPDKQLDPSFHDLIHECTHEFLHLDGKILTTLKALIFSPGRLTTEHLAGRRARYIGPIRLYLTLSLIFFIVAAHAGKSDPVVLREGENNQSISIQVGEKHESGLEKRLLGAVSKATENPELFKHTFLTNTSRVMFVMVPLFALGLRIAYRNRSRHYPAFVYFSLHYHSLVFFALIVSDLVSFTHIHALTTWTILALLLWCLVYLLMAMRKVFGGTWRTTAIRIAALAFVYLPCFAIGVGAAAIISLFTL